MWSLTDHSKVVSYILLIQVLMGHLWGVKRHNGGTMVALLGANIAAVSFHVKVPGVTVISSPYNPCT